MIKGTRGGYLDNRWFTALFQDAEKNRPAIYAALRTLTRNALFKYRVDEDAREELEAQAWHVSLKAIGKFDPGRRSSALAYFTSVVRHAADKALAKVKASRQRCISLETILNCNDDNP